MTPQQIHKQMTWILEADPQMIVAVLPSASDDLLEALGSPDKDATKRAICWAEMLDQDELLAAVQWAIAQPLVWEDRTGHAARAVLIHVHAMRYTAFCI